MFIGIDINNNFEDSTGFNLENKRKNGGQIKTALFAATTVC